MKEFLNTKTHEYKKAACMFGHSEWIEIPEGAEILAETKNGLVFYKKHGDRFAYCFAGETEWGGTFTNPYDELGAFVTGFVWQRDQDEPFLTPECTLNDQYAEIEQVRQSAYDKQEGGSHYKKLAIQPMQYALANKLDYAQANVVKYVTRHADKNGKEDLLKAIHNIELMIEHYYSDS